ncbi:MAG: hypothetical protein ACP5T9_01920 [Thermoplasmata archaeon]
MCKLKDTSKILSIFSYYSCLLACDFAKQIYFPFTQNLRTLSKNQRYNIHSISENDIRHKTEEYYDWAFATNLKEVNLDEIIGKYKIRWRIVNIFRVKD